MPTVTSESEVNSIALQEMSHKLVEMEVSRQQEELLPFELKVLIKVM